MAWAGRAIVAAGARRVQWLAPSDEAEFPGFDVEIIANAGTAPLAVRLAELRARA